MMTVEAILDVLKEAIPEIIGAIVELGEEGIVAHGNKHLVKLDEALENQWAEKKNAQLKDFTSYCEPDKLFKVTMQALAEGGLLSKEDGKFWVDRLEAEYKICKGEHLKGSADDRALLQQAVETTLGKVLQSVTKNMDRTAHNASMISLAKQIQPKNVGAIVKKMCDENTRLADGLERVRKQIAGMEQEWKRYKQPTALKTGEERIQMVLSVATLMEKQLNKNSIMLQEYSFQDPEATAKSCIDGATAVKNLDAEREYVVKVGISLGKDNYEDKYSSNRTEYDPEAEKEQVRQGTRFQHP